MTDAINELTADFEKYARDEVQRFLKRILDEELTRLNSAAYPYRSKTSTKGTTMASGGLIAPLSARELEVLKLLATGASNQQMAGRLSISPETVKTHVSHILQKLNAHDRTHAAVKAVQLGLIDDSAHTSTDEDQSSSYSTGNEPQSSIALTEVRARFRS